MTRPRTIDRPDRARRVVVVGAGLAGLSAAMHLRGAGRDVTVVERAPGPGGLAAPVTRPAADGGRYLLDTGPTVLTMPGLVARCFAAVGEQLTDWLSLHRLDPAYRAEFADGSGLSVTSRTDLMADRVAALAGGREADGYRRYVAHVSELYRLEMDHFIDRNIDSPLDLLEPELVRLAAARGFARLAPTVARYVADPRLQRVLSFQALYAGVPPRRALALYGVITYMDVVEGVYYPAGGMSAVPVAMAAAAAKAGVDLVYDATVTGLAATAGRVDAVVTADGRRFAADAVVLTCDPAAARGLLGRPEPRRRVAYSPSCVVLAAGLRRGLRSAGDESAHHSIHFGRVWDAVFDDLSQNRLMRDPSFLVSLPTVTDPGLAPEGSGTAYLLFPTPNLDHPQPLDWTVLRDPYREHVLRVAERAGYDLAGNIDAESLVTPLDWAERGCAAGTPFAAAHTFAQTGPFRAGNLLAENVVLAGAGTTPGVGVPMVLISGRLAAERVTGPLRAPTGRPVAV